MKRLIFLLSVTILQVCLNAEVYQIQDFKGGLNTKIDPLLIGDNETPYAKNVLFDENNTLYKRKGYTEFATLPISGKVLGAAQFTRSSGERWIIVQISSFVYSSKDNGANWTLVKSGLSLSSPLNYAVYMDEIWMTNGFDNVMSYNGSTITEYSFIPKGKYIIAHYDSIFVANILGEPSNVYWSSVLAGPKTASGWQNYNSLTFQKDDGDIITGLVSYRGNIVVFKNNSTWGILGYGNNLEMFKYSGIYGCVSAKSIQEYKNDLIFLSKQGLCSFNNGSIIQIDKVIEGETQNILGVDVKSNISNYILTSKNDFDNGTYENSLYSLDHQGVIIFSSQTILKSEYERGNANTYQIFTSTTHGCGRDYPGENMPFTFSQKGLLTNWDYPYEGAKLYSLKIPLYFWWFVSPGSGEGTSIKVNFYTLGNYSVPFASTTLNTTLAGCRIPPDYNMYSPYVEVLPYSIDIGTNTRIIYDVTIMSTNKYVLALMTYWPPRLGLKPETGFFGDIWSKYTIQLTTAVISNVGYYYTPLIDLKKVYSHGYFTVFGNANNYYYRSAISSQTIITQDWTPINNGDLITAPTTHIWIQFKAELTNLLQSLSTLQYSWAIEAPTTPISSIVSKERYFVAYSTYSNINTDILILDNNQRFTKWFGISADLLLNYNNDLLAFNGDTGKIYKLLTGDNDNGNPIEMIWTSKYLDFGSADIDKRLNKIGITGWGDGVLEVGYKSNYDTSFSTFTISLNNRTDNWVVNLPILSPQKYWQIRLKHNDLDKTINIHKINLYYDYEPLKSR